MATNFGRAAFLLSVSLLALPMGAEAQDAMAPAAAPADTAQGGGDDIIVTALRRSTRVQETPVAITALSEKSLQSLGATGIADVVRQVPGLNLIAGESGRTRISIRGIQTAGESTVGLYYGETPLTGPSGTSSDPSGVTPNLNLFDVERVEVLRGPQGTLYGSGSMGGTLRVIFKKPDLAEYEGATELGGEAVEHGEFGYSMKGVVNVPLFENVLGARLVLYRQQNPGYVDDATISKKNLNRSVLEGARFQLGFEPTDTLAMNFMTIVQTQKFDGTSQWAPSVGKFQSEQKIASPAYDKLQLYALETKWETPIGTLALNNSFYRWDVRQTNDNSDNYASIAASNRYCGLYQNTYAGSLLQGTSAGASTDSSTCASDAGGYTSAQLQADYQTWAAAQQPIGNYQPRFVRNYVNELRLSSNGSGPLGYTLGLFREDRNDRVDTMVFAGVPATGEPQSPVIDLGSRYVTDEVKQTAIYGEVSYRLFEPLTLTAGLRYYDYKKTVGGANLGYNYFNGQEPTDYREVSANANGFIQKYNLDFKVAPDIMFYATASQGFRPGGANLTPGIPESAQTYAADSLWNYEAGFKTQWFDRKLTFNIDAYRIDWNNLQTSVRATYGNFSYIGNVGSARIEGVEAEASVRPVMGLNLNGSFHYLYPRLTADQVSAEVSASGLKGDILPLIPRITASAGAEYSFPAFQDFNGLLRADWTYTGKMTSQIRPTNSNYREFGKYSLVNLRAGVESERLGVFLYVRNLFNTVGVNSISSATGVADYWATTAPRTLGATLYSNF
ncbi:TonB-dependent receptor [Novosphingobium profundi]|uniref:TonB-dependent receptor n=1 Tax=Novosphingobium profundi TaxID=1774954 RepID=UPI001BD92282|nr:TonB-dependent receptor [Novosphingobium profundi]MBT0668033.1 TonB-dependent receptor [Novosphingobium profundi]